MNDIFELKEISEDLESFNSKVNSVFRDLNKNANKNLANFTNQIKGYSTKLNDAFNANGLQGSINEINNSLKRAFNNLSSNIAGIIDSFDTAYDNMFIKLKGFPTTVKTSLTTAFTPLKTNPFTPLTKALTAFGILTTKIFSVTALGSIALFAGALAGIKAYYDRLMESNEEFRAKVNEAWAGVKAAFEPAIDAFGELFACLATGSETAGNSAASIADSFLTVITGITSKLSEAISFIAEMISGIAEFIKDIMFSTNEGISGNTETTWQAIKTSFEDVFGALEEIFSVAAELLSEIWDLFNEDVLAMFSSTWSTIAEVFSGVANTLSGLVGILTGVFTGSWEKVGKSFKKVISGIKDVFSSLLDFIKNLLGNIGSMIASAIGGVFDSTLGPILTKASNLLGKLFGKSGTSGISSIASALGSAAKALKTSVGIPKLAAGGLVDPGQFFVAREAGPELVGSFGARTAVMNNNQIVDAVSDGVFRAVNKAFQSNSGVNGTYVFQVNLDNREIGRQVIKYHNGLVKQYGHSPLII